GVAAPLRARRQAAPGVRALEGGLRRGALAGGGARSPARRGVPAGARGGGDRAGGVLRALAPSARRPAAPPLAGLARGAEPAHARPLATRRCRILAKRAVVAGVGGMAS